MGLRQFGRLPHSNDWNLVNRSNCSLSQVLCTYDGFTQRDCQYLQKQAHGVVAGRDFYVELDYDYGHCSWSVGTFTAAQKICIDPTDKATLGIFLVIALCSLISIIGSCTMVVQTFLDVRRLVSINVKTLAITLFFLAVFDIMLSMFTIIHVTKTIFFVCCGGSCEIFGMVAQLVLRYFTLLVKGAYLSINMQVIGEIISNQSNTYAFCCCKVIFSIILCMFFLVEFAFVGQAYESCNGFWYKIWPNPYLNSGHETYYFLIWGLWSIIYIIVFGTSLFLIVLVWYKKKFVWRIQSSRDIFTKASNFAIINMIIWLPMGIYFFIGTVVLPSIDQQGINTSIMTNKLVQNIAFYFSATLSGVGNSFTWMRYFRKLGNSSFQTPVQFETNGSLNSSRLTDISANNGNTTENAERLLIVSRDSNDETCAEGDYSKEYKV